MTTAQETVVGQLEPEVQQALVISVRAVIAASKLHRPCTPNGKPMRVRVTAAGELGWMGDTSGYRYTPHDFWGNRWPAMPEAWRVLASRFAPVIGPRQWDSAIINWYDPGAALGWHQDKSEADLVDDDIGQQMLARIRLLEADVMRLMVDLGVQPANEAPRDDDVPHGSEDDVAY